LTVALPSLELFPLLKKVSRSFYLSVRFLPSRIRSTIAIAYLLARASDTIADTNKLDAAYRLETLTLFQGSLEGRGDGVDEHILQCVGAQPPGSERDLLEQLDSLVASVRYLPPRHRVLVLDVLKKIVRAQTLDIQRFEMADSLHALASADELEEYTYLVAGSVGEFWTRICMLEWLTYSKIEASELERLSVEFGKGLQLTNILRDFPTDLAQKRSYLPVADPTRLNSGWEGAGPLFFQWRKRALEHLNSGWKYVRAIRPTRVRFACALPVLIGVRTLHRLDRIDRIGVKVSRVEVYWLMALSLVVAFVPPAAGPVYRLFFGRAS
jgi:farnesyl-diphosphate farnesyltransferase